MKASDLFKDAGTGQLSHTKLWANVAYIVATAAFLQLAFACDKTPDADIWLIYLGVIGSHCAVSKLVSMRYRGGQNEMRSPLDAYRDAPGGRDELGG
ncbi:MAG: hypothetical protein AAB658_20440 [Chloroflexota bacterium]